MLSIFFFNDTATTEIYTLSLHDALPISYHGHYTRYETIRLASDHLLIESSLKTTLSADLRIGFSFFRHAFSRDRKSTRLNSSHANISYAVFCFKKKQLSRIPSYP